MSTIGTGTAAFYERGMLDMGNLRTRAENLQQQIGKGERLARSSDDPVAASRLRQLARADRLATIDTTNAERLTSDLALADTTLNSIADLTIRAKELAVQAASETLGPDQRKIIGEQLAHIEESLFTLANTRDFGGHALLGGETAGAAYVRGPGGSATYVGTASSGTVPISEGQTIARGLTGPEVLNFSGPAGPTDLLATIRQLAADLQGASPNPAASAATALDVLSSGLDAVTTAQTQIGTRMAWIDMMSERRTSQSEMRADERGNIGDVDLGATIARLQQTMTVLEASQASFTKLANLSLFDRLN